ncbi:MAG: SHOCT domain-containing protein [Acidimicrobiia bacterium]
MVPSRGRGARRLGFRLGRAIRRGQAEYQAGATQARTEELERLADLHDRGVLNDEEFEQEKRRLLDS